MHLAAEDVRAAWVRCGCACVRSARGGEGSGAEGSVERDGLCAKEGAVACVRGVSVKGGWVGRRRLRRGAQGRGGIAHCEAKRARGETAMGPTGRMRGACTRVHVAAAQGD